MTETLKKRLKAPSTWVGMALLIQLLKGTAVPPEVLASMAGTIIDLLTAFGAGAGIIMAEKGRPDVFSRELPHRK